MARYTKQERAQAIKDLRRILKPGDTVYTILRSVARSGMSRQMDVFKIDSDGHPLWLTGCVCKALGWQRKGDHMVVQGCGMDMGFHAVYSLSRVLFPGGFGCIGERPVRCPSNDHSNGDRDYTPHTCDADRLESGNTYASHHKHQPAPIARGKHGVCHYHTDGGYALRHRWL